MTNPKFAVATDKGRYYRHPITGEFWPSVTNVLDTCINKPVLVPWAAKITAQKAWDELPRMLAAERNETAREELTREIKAEVRYVRDTAADLGTRVHDWSEAHVLGAPTPNDSEVEPFARQVIEFFDLWGVDFTRDVEATECTVVNRAVGYAGTLDLLVWLRLDPTTRKPSPKRFLWLVDYKTSTTKPADVTYPEHGLQLAALRNGETALLRDGTEEPLPGPIAAAAILSLRPNSHALVPMPAGPEAFAAFASLVPAAKYLHGVDQKPAPVQPPALRPVSGAA